MGRPVPPGYARRPTLPAHLVFYEDAFWSLNNDRQIGHGIGGIPFTAIDLFARRYGITDTDEFDRFRMLIKMMDSEYLDAVNGKGDSGMRDVVDASNVEGVKSILSRLAPQADDQPLPSEPE